eukprot:3437836-Amphidinium_carterae.1
MYALYAALDMYAGRRRVLLQGAVSEPVTATHGMPPGCGHAVDLLHAFLLKTLKSTGRHVSVRKFIRVLPRLEADYKVKWDSARALHAEVATKRPDFGGLETSLSTPASALKGAKGASRENAHL